MADSISDDYGRRTLEFVAAAAKASSRAEVVRLTLAELDWYGLTYLTSWSAPSEGGGLAEAININTRPADYVEHYFRNDLFWRDPVIAALRQSLDTLTWSDVRSRLTSKAERNLIEEGREFGATDGLTIPVFSQGTCIGAFGACGREPNLSPRARSALELVGLYANQALARADMQGARQVAQHVALTPREREVMRWVAVGKTNDEIADILTIGTATVKTILARAQIKLNATRRTYAVVQALRLGELDMNF